MIEFITAPKWNNFHDSIAGMLNITVVLIDSQGKPVTIYPEHSFSELNNNKDLIYAYHDFFLNLTRFKDEKSSKILYDPLGLPVGFINLGNVSIILGGILDKNDPHSSDKLKRMMKTFDIPDNEFMWQKLNFLSLEELKETINYVENFYTRLVGALNETSKLGHQMMLLAAVEEINKLTVSLLTPDNFELNTIQDLITNTLIILFDADSSWVFTHRKYDKSITTHKGNTNEFLQRLEQDWKSTIKKQKKTQLQNKWGKKILDPDLKIKNTFKQIDGLYCASIGVVNPRNNNVEVALSAFQRQLTIALEFDSLYQVLLQRMGTILNSIRHGIVVTNQKGQLALINESAKNTFNKIGIALPFGETLLGKKLSRSMETAVHDAIQYGNSFIKQNSILGDEHISLYLNWDIIPLLNEDGRIMGTILVIEDITDNVNISRQLQEWERLATAGQVAAGLAHEIRNPMAAATAAIQFFEMVKDKEKQKEVLNMLNSELERMNNILTDFMNVCKPSSQENLESVDLTQIVNEIKSLLKSEAYLYDIDFVIHQVSDSLPLIKGNKNSLKQVLLNIAKNSIEAMKEGGRLEIYQDFNDSITWVTIKDNGPGIPKDILDNIFRPFFTTKPEGSGLGLSVSSSIVKNMGGKLFIESKVGQGTSVKIIFPIYKSIERVLTND
ncbi:two-component system sensor histidine kinase NtrB [Candidatus Contubernalis alkaliaceticus]|uniref:two-component system sensor histidine kinase NtrB n=1 Tax=Candidatus Contubernalis alkaliaceticus TaxID=338645 RepID=UPI001F4C484C|nr:ATP-binding protein [Candidatus Contubernalis alkalaceticus]UNC91944.1 hypothetical protein HUE98_07440 [Candidatus Contubernalis alkalaceticus]